MMCLRALVVAVLYCAIASSATMVSPGFSGTVTGLTTFDLAGGAPEAVSFYYIGEGAGSIEVFDDVDAMGNSLGSFEIVPATNILTAAGVAFPGAIGRSIVFDLEGSIVIEQLTFGGLVIPEPGTFFAVGSGLLVSWFRSRRRRDTCL